LPLFEAANYLACLCAVALFDPHQGGKSQNVNNYKVREAPSEQLLGFVLPMPVLISRYGNLIEERDKS
jgi:hypothetical protein